MDIGMTRRFINAMLFCSLAHLNSSAFALTDQSEKVGENVTDANLPHTVLRLPNVHPGRDAVYAYARQLLSEALAVTEDKYGSFELVVSQEESAQERQLRSLEHNMLDVTWSVASTERESHFLPIRIPIMAGLFGKRVLFIREGDQRFRSVESLQDLKAFRAVMGYDWPDTKVFKANDVSVLETTYRASFRIVSEGFADMFPRSVMEIREEFEDKALSRGLIIEDSLLISYDNPIFYFVASDNTLLAERIAKGLLILIENGRFHTLLSQQPGYEQSMKLMKNRKLVELTNPLVSDQSREALSKFLHEHAISHP
ncbi:transporter substrate-binding domain-containing protein [Alteromonas sp. D210916BOD_24]|uniref:amino acid ABC transporter substrate-binding protein n=1 Tax=Alteromonas sp. D210916BOD_24 TaxID=3157618 RepID=UPI00399C9817